jgi:hypothetical protein
VQEFKVKSGLPPTYMRALVAGAAGSGKTTFAASAPAPLFISDAMEGGYKTLFTMPNVWWWDVNTPPEVWVIENAMAIGNRASDINTILGRLEKAKLDGKFPWKTIVIDPLSVYVDRVLSELQQANAGGDNRQLYGRLADHLRVLLNRFHALPAHILWLCHTKAEGGLSISGQMGEKFPSFCDFKWMLWANSLVPTQPPTFELHTQPFRMWQFLGGRWPLPSPLPPSFKAIFPLLGMPDRPVSPAFPGYPNGIQM